MLKCCVPFPKVLVLGTVVSGSCISFPKSPLLVTVVLKSFVPEKHYSWNCCEPCGRFWILWEDTGRSRFCLNIRLTESVNMIALTSGIRFPNMRNTELSTITMRSSALSTIFLIKAIVFRIFVRQSRWTLWRKWNADEESRHVQKACVQSGFPCVEHSFQTNLCYHINGRER